MDSSGIDHEAKKCAGHSYRIEAVTTASTCGMPWESSAYTFYTRAPPSVLCLVTRTLAEVR